MLDRRLNLAIHNITQAAKSPNPSYLFDAAAPIHLAKWFKLSKRETRQLQQYLDVLVRKASLRIEVAFPVVTSSSSEVKPWVRRALKTSLRTRLPSVTPLIVRIGMGTTATISPT